MEILQAYWSWFAVAVVVYMIGEGTKRLTTIWVPDALPEPRWPLWYRIWNITMPVHPVTGAALFGFVPLPVPSFVTSLAAKLLYFAVAGAVCGQVYEIVKRGIAGLKLITGGRSTPPPPPPADPQEPVP